MEDSKPESDKKLSEKVESFIEKKAVLILLIILIGAFIIRLKYLTINSAVWWDEADYLTLAKHFGLGLPEQAAPWRARPIPWIWGLFYYLGATEYFIRILSLLVSVGGVYLAFVIGKEFYGKKIGLFSALFMAVYHENLFWTARISMDTYAIILFGLLALFFYRGYVKDMGRKYLYAAGALFGYGVYAYDSTGFFAVMVFFYLIATEKLRFLKNKKFWCVAVAAVIAFIPWAIYHQVQYGTVYPRITSMIGPQVVSGVEANRPLAANLQEYFSFFMAFPYYLKGPIFLFFLLGLLLFYELFIGFDIMLKGKEGSESLKRDYYVLLWALVLPFMFGFVVMLSNFYYEARYLLPAMPIYLAIAGRGLFKVQEYIAKHNYLISLAVVLVVIVMSINSQLAFADQIIQAKKDTYIQERLGGEWVKQYTSPGEPLVGCCQTVQILYYTERTFTRIEDNDALEKFIKEKRPRFYILDFLDPFCSNVRYPIENPDKMRLANIFFYDQEQKQPVYLIFEINQSAYS